MPCEGDIPQSRWLRQARSRRDVAARLSGAERQDCGDCECVGTNPGSWQPLRLISCTHWPLKRDVNRGQRRGPRRSAYVESAMGPIQCTLVAVHFGFPAGNFGLFGGGQGDCI